MESEFQYWVGKWTDHLIDILQNDIDVILAHNAEALEFGDAGELPEEVLTLFRIGVERTRNEPETAIRFAQASYAATFRVIRDLLQGRNP